ncbi:sulfurtransferase [Candidatus Fermentibacteria bacterium]|nr:MAG: sulfurtransferase [Candidatus Fermentibacteria bacterium]
MFSRADITRSEMISMVQKGGKLIDVRSAGEYRAGHLSGAVNVPVDSLPDGISSLGLSSDTVIILYCASGMRSASAKQILKRAGYTNVLNGGAMRALAQ